MRSINTFVCVGLCLLVIGIVQAQQQTFIDTETGVSYTVERYIPANYPVAMAFAPDGRLFYTEKVTGNVRVVSADGELQPEPVINLPTSANVERGMLGIALDPDYIENGMIWVAHISEATARDFPQNRIVRFHEQDGVGSDPEVMFGFPLENSALIHHGGNLHFDPDGYLFYSIGDNEIPAYSQDLTTPQGAIHRFAVTDTGLVPAPDNPFEDSTIYAYGLRNSFDFDFDPVSGHIFATENGDQCDDEINRILPGFNYGAGENYECGGTAADISLTRYLPGLLSFTPTIAPTGIVIYDHPAVPAWEHDLFFCNWTDGILRRVELNAERNAVENVYELDLGDAQCRIDLAIGPEGGLYFSSVSADSGAIFRLLPVE